MAKKSKKRGLPKRIAGIKIPKAVRNGPIGELLVSDAGQAMIAQAVLAFGAAATSGVKKAGAGGKMQRTAGKAAGGVHEAGAGAANAGGALAYALGEAARSFVDALRESGSAGDPAPQREPDWTASPLDGDQLGSKKKPISYEAGPV